MGGVLRATASTVRFFGFAETAICLIAASSLLSSLRDENRLHAPLHP